MSERTTEEAQRSTAGDYEPASDSLGEILRTVLYAILIAFTFRTLLFQPFSIPSGSMKPTLLINDYLFVSKYSYGYSKYALPYGNMLPNSMFGGRVLFSEPERGDVIVFRNPKDENQDYIKRLVGLPGDTVQMRRGVLHINGEPAKLVNAPSFIEPRDYQSDEHCIDSYDLVNFVGLDQNTRTAVMRDRARETCIKAQKFETLPGGVTHPILDSNGPGSRMDNTRRFTVPADHYFFVGDNRDNSLDSRDLHRGIGFVPRQNLIGRAEMILLSAEGAYWQFWNWRSDRFFKAIK